MRKRKPTNKTYDIDSLERLVNVIDRHNFENITMDLILWLGYVVQVFEEYRKKFPKMTKGKTNWEIAQSHFIWTDDGKNEQKGVTVRNTLTGEIRTLELRPKKKPTNPQNNRSSL